MKIGIYGGSFNPVHYGHIGMVKWVLENTDLDEVWMLVSPKSPLKVESRKSRVDSAFDLDTNYDKRLAEVRLAVSGERLAVSGGKRVVVSDFERNLPRPSYTANTLRALQKAYPEHAFTLLIGEDNWQVFDKWREWEYILANYRVFVYPRRVDSRKSIVESGAQKNVVFLDEAPYFDVSSTEIREKMQKDLHI